MRLSNYPSGSLEVFQSDRYAKGSHTRPSHRLRLRLRLRPRPWGEYGLRPWRAAQQALHARIAACLPRLGRSRKRSAGCCSPRVPPSYLSPPAPRVHAQPRPGLAPTVAGGGRFVSRALSKRRQPLLARSSDTCAPPRRGRSAAPLFLAPRAAAARCPSQRLGPSCLASTPNGMPLLIFLKDFFKKNLAVTPN